MSARGISLMALGALGTVALIGLDTHGTASFAITAAAGLGALAVFFAGSVHLLRGRSDRAETARVDELADDVGLASRVHLLAGRHADLLRQIDAAERRRDEALAEAAEETVRRDGTAPEPAPRRPNLIMVVPPD